MKYLTFIDEDSLDNLLHDKITLTGEGYNLTVGDYVFGIVPRVENVVDQTVLLLTYMVHSEMTVCIRLSLDYELPYYNAIDVNNSAKHYTYAAQEESLAVIPSIDCQMVERSYAPDDVVNFHELVELHLTELLKLLGHSNYAKVKVDWTKVKESWNVMEKTGNLREVDFKNIKSAVSEV